MPAGGGRPPHVPGLPAAQRQERAVPRPRPGAPARPQPVGAAGPAGGRRPAPGGRGLVLRDSPRTARQGATGTIHAPARSVRRACRQRMPGRPTGSPAVPGWRLNGRNLSLLEAAEVIDSTWTSPAPRPGSANWARSRPVLPLHSQLQGYFHEQPGTLGPRLQPRRNPRCRTRRAEPGEDRRGHRPPGAGDRQRTAGHRVHQYPQVRGAGSAAEHRALHHDRHVVLPGQAGVGVVGLLLGLFGLFLGYQHRNSGKTPSCA